MKPERLLSLFGGIALLVVGAVSLAGTFFLEGEVWRLWPLIVLILGVGFTIPALFFFKNPGLGAFFFPAVPLLVTGGLLMAASLTNNWAIWAYAWPLEVLGVALSFVLAGLTMRVPGFAIPAAIIGLNGLLLQFCAATGLWQAWAVLWPIEPLSVGLGMLVFGLITRGRDVNTAALILVGIAGAGFFITSFIPVFPTALLNLIVPGMLIFTGVVLALMAFWRRDLAAPAAPAE